MVCFLHRERHCRRRDGVIAEIAMGKYAFAWLLGVPLGLLTLIYVLAHL